MPRCLISLGANLGDPSRTIGAATELLRHRLKIDPGAFNLSRLFRTPPVGGPAGQPPFINAVLAVETRLSSLEVWRAIRDVEQELGRQRDRRWEARRIDLDILLYEQERVWTPHLKIPHPRMCMRRFILLPALDVAAGWTDPVTQRTLRELSQPLQAGPGSLWLVSQDRAIAQPWLQEVAELASAQIVPADETQTRRTSRWVSLVSMAEFQQTFDQRPGVAQWVLPKLTVFLAEPSADPRAAWETQHLELAQRLHLYDHRWLSGDLLSAAGLATIDGPASIESVTDQSASLEDAWLCAAGAARYLLPGDDRQWAIHEMLSALEAMDCPIEPI